MQISKEEYAKLNRIIITLKQQKSELQETILKKELLLSKAQDRISKLETSPAFSNAIPVFDNHNFIMKLQKILNPKQDMQKYNWEEIKNTVMYLLNDCQK